MNDDALLPLYVRIYTLSRQGLLKLYQFAHACLVGFWLGVMNRESLYQLDKAFYDGEEMYQGESWNFQGFFDWEGPAIQEHFSGCNKLLVIAAGGGREMLALEKLGFEVDGYECNPKLVETAQRLLIQENLPAKVQLCPRDRCPKGENLYDGLIVGWGSYMHIQGRKRRVEFLKELRARAQLEAPVLLSFYFRKMDNNHYKLVHLIANLLRRVQFREMIEIGDDLNPHFVHNFTQAEIASELCDGGFTLLMYSDNPYGHAVGIAR